MVEYPEKATYREEYVKCGRPNCKRCPHGPYTYAYWRENGKLVKKYVGREPYTTSYKEQVRTRLDINPTDLRKIEFIVELEKQGYAIAKEYREKIEQKKVTLEWAYRRVRELTAYNRVTKFFAEHPELLAKIKEEES